MRRFLIVFSMMIFVVSCQPKKNNEVGSAAVRGGEAAEGFETPEAQAFMKGSVAELLQRDGTFIGELDPKLQQQFVERISRTQCANEWVGFLQRKRYKLLVDQMRPSLESGARILNSDGSESYFVPTTVVGYWIEIRKFQDRSDSYFGRVEIREYAPVRRDPTKMFKRIFRWRAQEGCKKSRTTKQYQVFRKSNLPTFSDRDLRDLIRAGSGLIYLWSPKMPYSTASIEANGKSWGLGALLKVAAEKGLKITFLLDPRSNTKEAVAAARKAKAKVPGLVDYEVVRGTSVELFMRMAGLHLPSMFYYANGQIAYNHLPGISEEVEMGRYIDEQQSLLSKVQIDRGGK